MGFAGRLEGIAPSDIFQIISQSKMTGTLIARCPEGTAMVVFKDGQVIEAASDATRESLGNLLISQGILSETTLAEAQVLQKQGPDTPLGMILVEMGAISAQMLESVVLKQIEQIVHRLVSCEDGFITFDRGEMALKRKLNTHEFLLPSGVSPEYLLMEDARALDEERRDMPAQPASAGARPPRAGEEPAREEFRAGLEKENLRVEVAVLKSLFHEIRLAKAADRGDKIGTLVRQGKKIAAAAGSMLSQHLMRLPGAVGRKVWASSPDGRTMALAGIAAIAVSLVLIFATTLTFHTEIKGSDLMVSKPVANIRDRPSAEGKVITKAEKGETVTYIMSTKGWYKVVTKTGVGWISQQLVERKVKTGLTVTYDMKGYELGFLAGLALVIMGIAQKKGNP